ncbi:hypothetical protein ACDI16_16930, partial [Oceanobacillus caeni]
PCCTISQLVLHLITSNPSYNISILDEINEGKYFRGQNKNYAATRKRVATIATRFPLRHPF